MRILRSRVFQIALERYPEHRPDIAALLSFLSRIEIKTASELLTLFPDSSSDEAGITQIGFAGSFAGGNLVFKGRFNYPGQFVLAEDIEPVKS